MGSLNYFRNSDDAVPFSAGQTLFKEGDPGENLYVVSEGEVDILVRGKCIETVGPGGLFGEMALIDSAPRSATAVARTDCKVVPINEKRFTFLVQQTPFFALEVMRILAGRLRNMDSRL